MQDVLLYEAKQKGFALQMGFSMLLNRFDKRIYG